MASQSQSQSQTQIQTYSKTSILFTNAKVHDDKYKNEIFCIEKKIKDYHKQISVQTVFLNMYKSGKDYIKENPDCKLKKEIELYNIQTKKINELKQIYNELIKKREKILIRNKIREIKIIPEDFRWFRYVASLQLDVIDVTKLTTEKKKILKFNLNETCKFLYEFSPETMVKYNIYNEEIKQYNGKYVYVRDLYSYIQEVIKTL